MPTVAPRTSTTQNASLDKTRTAATRAKLKRSTGAQTGSPDLKHLVRRLCTLYRGRGIPNPQDEGIGLHTAEPTATWIKTLDKSGELKRITAEVDPILEMAEIADRTAKSGRGTSKAGGPALLFENVKGPSQRAASS